MCVSTETQVVSHGRVNDVVLRENDYCVHLVVNSDISKDLPATVNIEIISQCHSYRRMITAVKNLPQTSEDIRSLFLTRDLHSPVKQSRPKGQLISSFLLDASQRKAVNRAINSSFTVIEGRSGWYHLVVLFVGSVACLFTLRHVCLFFFFICLSVCFCLTVRFFFVLLVFIITGFIINKICYGFIAVRVLLSITVYFFRFLLVS